MSPAVTQAAQRVVDKTQALDKAMSTIYETVQLIDKREPKLAATLRTRYGLIQQLSALANVVGDLDGELGAFFKALDNGGLK